MDLKQIDALISKFINENKIINSILTIFLKTINNSYLLGVDTIEKNIEANLDYKVDNKAIKFLRKTSFEYVKDINTDLANKLRGALERSIISGKSFTEVTKEVKGIFKTTKARAESIVKTETSRAYNIGSFTAAQEAQKEGYKIRKYYAAVIDNRTSPLCRRLTRKYTRDNAININQKFKDDMTGESWLFPPTHTNCRSEAIYILID